jgi:hypothetical protein
MDVRGHVNIGLRIELIGPRAGDQAGFVII